MGMLENLYKDVILEHYKRPRNHGPVEPHTHEEEGFNPVCGDELTLYLDVHDGKVQDVGFVGEGCAISQAAASMMTDAIKGETVERALTLARAFRTMIQGGEVDPALGDLQLLQGISRLHARVKCATLPWVTLERALAEEAGPLQDAAPGASAADGVVE